MSAGQATPDLSGLVVLITGVGRGLGRALLLRALDAGARVVGCARSPDDLDALEGVIDADRCLLVRADVADARAMERFVDEAQSRFRRIDGLILNASVLGERRPLRAIDPETWARVIDVNLTGAFNACRAAIPALRRSGGGSIIAVSSGVGDEPRRDWGPYAVSKWALEGLARNLALEEEAAGIRVNIVDPGPMRTAMRRAAYPEEDPATLPDPAAFTSVYLWLLHPSSRGVTGRRFIAREWAPERR